MKNLNIFAILAAIALIGGCSFSGEPRPRLAGYPTNTIGSRFIDANELGHHSYSFPFSEGAGIAYTCRGGHIDTDHLRISADWTRYLAEKTYEDLRNSDSEFTYKLNVDPSMYFAYLQYPANWKNLDNQQRDQLAKEVSIELGAYLTYYMVTWHEILTWYGFHTVGFLPEFPSAFSWEDNYSNLLGTRIATEALKQNKMSYDDAMTVLIKKEFENLGVVSAKTSRYASEKMRGKWFTGIAQPDIMERNMDIGLANGRITPTLVPGICPDAEPQSYPVPSLYLFHKYGFKMELQVEPRTWEKHKILKLFYGNGKGNRVNLPQDLPIIIADMKKEAAHLGYNTMPKNEPASQLAHFYGD
jgi:hypothetical protein